MTRGLDNWRTDGWKYTDELSGVHETRHEAVGAAAVSSRERRESYGDHAPIPTVEEQTGYVYAFKPFRCGYCGETFLTEVEHDEHQTCPHYEPAEGRRGSNPVEASHMSRRNR